LVVGEGIELPSIRSLFKMEPLVMKKKDDTVNEERRWGFPSKERI